MKDQGSILNGEVGKVVFTPTYDGERAIAHTEAGLRTAGVVEVDLVPRAHAEAIEEGQPGAAHDILFPNGEHGHHRIIVGVAYLAQIDGEPDPKIRQAIVGDGFFETLPEPENKQAPHA